LAALFDTGDGEPKREEGGEFVRLSGVKIGEAGYSAKGKS